MSAINIVILVNENEAPTSRLHCGCIPREDTYTSIRLDDHQLEMLTEPNLFIVNPVFAMDDKSNEELLIDSINNNPKLQWFTWLMKETIPISTFTIFINNNGVTNGIMDSHTFDPLCIATVDLVDIDCMRYLYVHTLCCADGYTNGEVQLMNALKMIAFKFRCEQIRIDHLDNNYDYSWLISQHFVQYTDEEIIKYKIEVELEKYSYTYYYDVNKGIVVEEEE